MLRRSLLALLLCCSLAGCGDDEPKPKFEPRTETTSSTPPPATETSEPGLVAPEMPALAKKHTTAGAEAFVEFYWEVADYALLTGDTGALRKLAGVACKACEAAAAGVESDYASGAQITGGDTSTNVVTVEEFQVGTETGLKVTVDVTNTKQVTDFPDPKKDQTYAAATTRLAFYLAEARPGWVATSWDSA